MGRLARWLVISIAGLAVGACGTSDKPAMKTSAKEIAADPSLGDGGLSAFYSLGAPAPRTPGKLVRTEPLSPAQSLANAATGTRILYSSTDGLGGTSPVVVSGALFLPKGDAPAGGWPLLAWAHGTVGVADICAPSWAGRGARDVTYLNFWLAQGYAIVASDYQGLGVPGGHPYLATRPAAYSLLDSVRAVQNGQFPVSRKVVVIGQSQGGGAAFATAGYFPKYAPDLDVRGIVATGTPYFSPEAQVALQAARPKDAVDPLLGYNFLAMSLLQQIDSGFRIEDYVSDDVLPAARSINQSCFGAIAQRVMAEKISYSRAYTKKDPSQLLLRAYALMGYPTLALRTPVFMGTGGQDRDAPTEMQLNLVSDACKAGSPIESHLYPSLDHSGTVNGSTADSSIFVKTAFAGAPLRGNCSTRPRMPSSLAPAK